MQYSRVNSNSVNKYTVKRCLSWIFSGYYECATCFKHVLRCGTSTHHATFFWIKKQLFYNGHIYACYRLFTLEFVMEMYTKWGANSTMDYDWLGMKSKQHLTTELIETRLTKDILLDGIGEMGKKRWELTYPKTLKMIFHNAYKNLLKAFR